MKKTSKSLACLLYILIIIAALIRFVATGCETTEVWKVIVEVVVFAIGAFFSWKSHTDFLLTAKALVHGTSDTGAVIPRIPRWMILLIPIGALLVGAFLASFFKDGSGLAEFYSMRQAIIVVSAFFLMLSSKREYADTKGKLALTATGLLAILLISRKMDATGVGVGIVLMILISDILFRREKTILSFFQSIFPAVLAIVGYELIVPSNGLALYNALRWEWNTNRMDSCYLYDCVRDGGALGKTLVAACAAVSVCVCHLASWRNRPPIEREKSLYFLVCCYFPVLCSEITCSFCQTPMLYIPDVISTRLAGFMVLFCINALKHIQQSKSLDNLDTWYEELNTEIDTITVQDEDGNDVSFWFVDLVSVNDIEYVLLYPTSGDALDKPEIFRLEDAEDLDGESYVLIDDNDIKEMVYKTYRSTIRWLHCTHREKTESEKT